MSPSSDEELQIAKLSTISILLQSLSSSELTSTWALFSSTIITRLEKFEKFLNNVQLRL